MVCRRGKFGLHRCCTTTIFCENNSYDTHTLTHAHTHNAHVACSLGFGVSFLLSIMITSYISFVCCTIVAHTCRHLFALDSCCLFDKLSYEEFIRSTTTQPKSCTVHSPPALSYCCWFVLLCFSIRITNSSQIQSPMATDFHLRAVCIPQNNSPRGVSCKLLYFKDIFDHSYRCD